MWLGAHLGISGGLGDAVREARKIGGESLQIFSKSPQMWSGPPIAPAAAEEFRSAVVAEGIRATAVHHAYLANLASPKPFMLKRSRTAFLDEVRRADLLGVDGLIFHPGAHLGSGPEVGLRTIAESLRFILEELPESRVRLLLENAAGQGTTLGSTFEELASVLAQADRPDRLGVTLDTCHLFAAGFDFRDESGYGRLMDDVERVLGAGTVRAFHLNDAKEGLGSHLDRHENIGKGKICTPGFRHIVNDRRWDATPGYLETPLDDRGYARYAEDLSTLRSLLGAASVPPTARKPARRAASRPSTPK
ncbi:MAG: deoxyribonuclease IV [Thermoplasmata archaeon]